MTDQLRTCILQYFAENSNPEISPISLWEAHKCVLHGELITLATKKQHQEYINSLIRTIKSLETSHKRTHAQATLQDLMRTRANLLEELGKCSKRRYILGQMIFYEQGNKCGHLLACTVQNSKPTSTIHHIRSSEGDLVVKNEDIAKEFEKFYFKLYNLPSHDSSPYKDNTRAVQIKDFLSRYSPRSISPQQSLDLEGPILMAELDLAMKQMKAGKSPGPGGFSLQYYKSFSDALAPRLLAIFKALSDPQTKLGSMLAAHVDP